MKKYWLIFKNADLLKESPTIGFLTIDEYKKPLVTDVFKRSFDVFFSFSALLLLLPLYCIIYFLIQLESPGSPIFIQERVGQNGQIFKMYKFRSMVNNAEDLLDNLRDKNEIKGAMFKMKKDPRVTKVGRILRKTSLDELPQLLNVLKGEMSLVGPRPPLISEVKQYTNFDYQRLLVKPGCSGLWQVCGRSSVDFETMVKLDIIYIKNRNFIYDLLLIIKTIIQMFFPKNAY